MSETPLHQTPEQSDGDQFARLTEALMAVIQNFPDYFNQREVLRAGLDEAATVSGEARGTAILHELAVIKTQLEAGQLTGPARVRVFGGIQSREVSSPNGLANNQLIAALYKALSPMSKAPAEHKQDYYDLQNYAKELQAKSFTSVAGAEYRFLWGDDKALTDKEGKHPVGILLKIGDNLFTEFDINRFDEPGHETEGMSSVDLYVVPGAKPATRQ